MVGARVREHAELLVDWCTDVQAGDLVTIVAAEPAKDLVTALHAALGRRDADPVTVAATLDTSVLLSGEPMRAFLQQHDGAFETPAHLRALLEASDVVLLVKSEANVNVLGDVPAETKRRRTQAMAPLLEELAGMERSCATQHPTRAVAQRAGMSLSAYEDFVYGAMLRDWAAVSATQERVRERLAAATEARIVGPDTDLTMRLDGMLAANDDGKRNFPGGEVYTAPVVDSVTGHIHFDKPALVQGQDVGDVRLTLEDGVVTAYSAARNEAALASALATDAGAERIGEFGIGLNDGIDRITKNMLFDEKMAGTVHLALGRAYEHTVGEGREQNHSGLHLDLLMDMADARLEFDGEVVQRDGTFLWDDAPSASRAGRSADTA